MPQLQTQMSSGAMAHAGFQNNQPQGTIVTISLPLKVRLVSALETSTLYPSTAWGPAVRTSQAQSQACTASITTDDHQRINATASLGSGSGNLAPPCLLLRTRVLLAEDNK